MATFTTLSKNKISWVAPAPVAIVGEAYELLIADTYKLDIGDGFYLTIKPAATSIQYTNVGKTKNTWPAPASVKTDYFINIGDDFNLLIDNSNKLIINPRQAEVPWTTISRKKIKY